jgi:Fic family protein
MKKKIPRQELLEILGRFPQGASIEEVMLVFTLRPRRTIQRWLAELVRGGQIEALGAARARRYRLIPQTSLSAPLQEVPILLSNQALEIQEFVTKPIAARAPVSYTREWLENYRPNHTQYISGALRKQLHAIGQVEEGQYPAGTFARQIFARLLVDLSWNSSRLEGNTYSFLDTERLIQWGDMPAGKDLKETQMILNHKAAIEFLINSAKEIGINRYTILNLHTLLSDNLMSDPAFCGRLRMYPVGISHSTYVPIAIPQVIEECFNLILEKARLIQDPFEQAFFLMVHIPYLQAFEDVNKRTSRLAANIPFIQHNLRPLSFVDVPEHLYINGLLGIYELNRIELLRDVFIWAYERSCARYATTHQSLGDPDPFRLRYRQQIRLAVQEIVELCLNRTDALKAIGRQAEAGVLPQDRALFAQLVEKELSSLHEGNIARYQIRPLQYAKWKEHLQY